MGDPLYTPFAVPLGDQLKDFDHLPPSLAGYATIRFARRLDSYGQAAKALAALREGMARRPNFALALALAERLLGEGERDEAMHVLGTAALADPLPADQWVMVRNAAELCADERRPDLAVELYRHLFAGRLAAARIAGPLARHRAPGGDGRRSGRPGGDLETAARRHGRRDAGEEAVAEAARL